MLLDIEKIKKNNEKPKKIIALSADWLDNGQPLKKTPRVHTQTKKSTQIKFQKGKHKRVPQGILRGKTTKWKGNHSRTIKKLKYNRVKTRMRV